MQELREYLRVIFLSKVHDLLSNLGFSFRMHPDFRSFRHGNLKFTDDRLTLRRTAYTVIVTLEHYAIKREGWHPIYWGLQCFSANGDPLPPEHLPEYKLILQLMQERMDARLPGHFDAATLESKYGWFAWICFKFPPPTSNLDDERIDTILKSDGGVIAIRMIDELQIFLEAWQEVVAALPQLI
jgi:hypothetical protein